MNIAKAVSSIGRTGYRLVKTSKILTHTLAKKNIVKMSGPLFMVGSGPLGRWVESKNVVRALRSGALLDITPVTAAVVARIKTC